MAKAVPDFLNAVWRESWRHPPFQPYRDLLRRAVPFSLDDDATRLVTALAMDANKTTLYRQLARLPYDVVWLELDHRVQVAEQRRLGSNRGPHLPGEEGDRCGYLIEKLGPTRWRAHYWSLMLVTDKNVEQMRKQTASNALAPDDYIPDSWPTLYVVDTESSVRDYRTRARDPFMRAAMQSVCDSDWGGAAGWGLGSIDPDERGGWRYDLPTKLHGAATIDLPYDWETGILARHLRPHERRDKLVEVLQATSKELAGTLRHICAALATINEVPLSHKEHAPGGTFRAGGMLRLFKVNRTVTISLPKAQATPKRVLSLFRGAKRRMARHQVRGHWRRFRHKEDGAWVWQRQWVEPFERGDAALGYVQHNYLVEGFFEGIINAGGTPIATYSQHGATKRVWKREDREAIDARGF
jgi:hypothetical protein